jgi:hypothetical protein
MCIHVLYRAAAKFLLETSVIWFAKDKRMYMRRCNNSSCNWADLTLGRAERLRIFAGSGLFYVQVAFFC